MFFTPTPLQWFTQLAWITGASLPATLAWLLLACSVKNALQHLPNALQYAVGVVLGAAAGLFACALLVLGPLGGSGAMPWAPWWASASAGALLAGALSGRFDFAGVLKPRGHNRTLGRVTGPHSPPLLI
jgi:two-component system sensor histidine kinase AlgZ